MLVSRPIFSVRVSPTKVQQAGFFEILALANDGVLLDLPGMAAHQRPAVVTVIAVIGHVLKRYGSGINLAAPTELSAAWNVLFGEDALRLEAPDNEVAFLQPPTDPTSSQQSIESADLLLPGVEHEVKRTWDTTPERALFAIIGSLLRPNVKDHRAATRTGLSCVLTSSDGSVGAEVINLMQAYDRLFSVRKGGWSARDHMVWLRPYRRTDPPIPIADLPKPFLDVGRAQRLRLRADGRIEIWANPNNTARVDGGPDPWVEDPHTPLKSDAKAATRYKLGAKDFGYAFEARLLFGGATEKELVTRPRIMDLTSYRYARLCALGTDQGKTRGYREALYRATRNEGLFSLSEPRPDDRPSRLSETLIRTLSEAEKSLWAALASITRTGNGKDATSDQIGNHGKAIFRARVTQSAISLIFDLLSVDRDDPSADQGRLNALVASELRRVFAIAVPTSVEPLASARAERQLEDAIRRKFPVVLQGATSAWTAGEEEVPGMVEASEREKTIPPLVRQVFAILTDFTKHLSPDDKAGLRTMSLASPPLSFWKLIASIPDTQSGNRRCLEIWKPVLRALGRVNQSRAPLGRVLARTSFPENRVSRLLSGSGTSLPGLVDEVGRWLVSHDVEHANLSLLATLGLADALGDIDARDWARRQLAIDYVRLQPSLERDVSSTNEKNENGEEEAA